MENMQNLYEVKKTVRFGLTAYENQSSKNKNYNVISQHFKENRKIKEKLEKYKKRITDSSNQKQWEEEQGKLYNTVKSIRELSRSIQETIFALDEIKNNSQYNFSVNFKISFIKRSCGF